MFTLTHNDSENILSISITSLSLPVMSNKQLNVITNFNLNK